MAATKMMGAALALTMTIQLVALTCVHAQAKVPAEFLGDWVPAKANCDSAARLRVAETQLTLINGKDSASFDDLAFPQSYFGPDYQGISVVVIPEINSSEPPFQAFFNVDEKKGVAKLDIYTEVQNVHPAMKAAQEMHKKLAQRFPLNAMELKKCGGK